MITCTITDARRIACVITGDGMSCNTNGLITIVRGESASLDLAFTTQNADGVEVPLNISGATVHFRVKRIPGNPADPVVIRKATGSGIVHAPQSGGSLGRATLTLAPADTDGTPPVAPGLYWFEVRILEASGFTRAARRGQFKVEGEVVDL